MYTLESDMDFYDDFRANSSRENGIVTVVTKTNKKQVPIFHKERKKWTMTGIPNILSSYSDYERIWIVKVPTHEKKMTSTNIAQKTTVTVKTVTIKNTLLKNVDWLEYFEKTSYNQSSKWLKWGMNNCLNILNYFGKALTFLFRKANSINEPKLYWTMNLRPSSSVFGFLHEENISFICIVVDLSVVLVDEDLQKKLDHELERIVTNEFLAGLSLMLTLSY